jgi:hypothetical protein
MNDKEKELWRVIDNVIKCCAIELPNGELSITREDVLGKSRAENLVMTRCMVVEQMIHAGFSITTTASIKPHRFSCETSLQDGLHLYQHVSSLSTCHGTSDPSKQGRRADLCLIKNKKKITTSVL